MENDECKAKPTREKIFDVKIGLSETLNWMMELREDWIKKQQYYNASVLRNIRLGLEKIRCAFEQLAKNSSHRNHNSTS